MGLIIDSSKATVASLFDGIGGAPLCAEMCGAVPIWSSEIEPFPIKVTQLRFPNMKQYGDITKINGADVEPVDIIVGGSPCQDLSVAGLRKGMKHGEFGDDEVTRSGLFMEQIRIIKEMRNGTNGTQPRFMVWENVPGAFSSANGEDFRAVLEETARIADPTVSIPRSPGGWPNSGSILGEGFSISWRTVDAQYWGVPQRRRRIYLVADFGGESAPEILFESEGLPWHFEKGGSKGQGTAREAEDRIGATGPAYGLVSKGNGEAFLMEEKHMALGCGGGQAGQGYPAVMVQPQVLPFNTTDRHAVAYGICSDKSNSMLSDNPHSGIYEADTARTLDQNGGNPACNQGGMMVVESRVYSRQRSDELVENDVTSTQSARQYKDATDLIVAGCDFRNDKENGDLCGTLQAKANGGFSYNCIHPVRINNLVRRLTPLECERLQGYPDGWTDIPGATDSPRYKSLGNSFAIPNAYFVISGCVEQIRKAASK